MIAMLVACGGGGGGGGGSTGGSGAVVKDNIPTVTSLAALHGLSGDANQNYPLFYIDASHDNGKTGMYLSAAPWLMAYDPTTGASTPVDKALSGLASSSGFIFPLAVHGATVDASSGKIESYHIDSVVYAQDETILIGGTTSFTQPTNLMGVKVTSTTPVKIADGVSSSGFVSPRQMVAFDLDSPMQAQYVYADNPEYGFTRLDAPSTQLVQTFGAGFMVQNPLFDTTAGRSFGWLVADKNQDDCLALVRNADLTTATCIPNADGSGKVVLAQDGSASDISGTYPLDDGVVLAIPESTSGGTGLSVTTTLWFYEKGTATTPGKLHLLKNSTGDSLVTTGLAMFGPDQAGLAVSKNGDTLYLAASDGGIGGLFGGGTSPDPMNLELHAFLYKITTAPGQIGWQQVYHKGGKLLEDKAAKLGDFLVDAGTHLLWEINEKLVAISLDGQHELVLDGRDSSGSTLTRGAFVTPVGVVSQGGWFYYNRESGQSDYATAVKVDGSKRVELKDCIWLGASTNGRANYTGGSFSSLEPSEVFMACNNKQIAAVNANDPAAGRVVLGSLAQTADSIAMGRAAPGPHRLVRVAYADDSFEVLYVNTREKNSLQHLMPQTAKEDVVGNLAGLTAPVNGF